VCAALIMARFIDPRAAAVTAFLRFTRRYAATSKDSNVAGRQGLARLPRSLKPKRSMPTERAL